eukprot:NODE_891_length_662_cov_346.292007_g821_i0.p5 GENE.NODE_891_length_662_cov_346.292007_g821_i0~~NODE_891_length_662_cov_346.292007_g821_i0.p5  ORF type:complete len:73 (-),score=6.66 NODE_891_length_662_cov_346.292007_g821_i0:42-260(-)
MQPTGGGAALVHVVLSRALASKLLFPFFFLLHFAYGPFQCEMCLKHVSLYDAGIFSDICANWTEDVKKTLDP